MASSEETMIARDALLDHMRNRVVPDPSPRTPSGSTHSNIADRIEAGYQADGHKTWGFVLYRTSYENDADWAEFMRRLRWYTADSMNMCNGQDVLNLMTWTVFDDQERFEDADASSVRRHFRQWAGAAVQFEQSSEVANRDSVSMGRSSRYRYCIQVDREVLEATVHDGPPPEELDLDRQGWVKLIDRNWLPRSEDPIYAGRPPDHPFEPIDGITDEKIGWIKCPFASIMTEYYMLFRDPNVYMRSHRRPPAVVGYPWT